MFLSIYASHHLFPRHTPRCRFNLLTFPRDRDEAAFISFFFFFVYIYIKSIPFIVAFLPRFLERGKAHFQLAEIVMHVHTGGSNKTWTRGRAMGIIFRHREDVNSRGRL